MSDGQKAATNDRSVSVAADPPHGSAFVSAVTVTADPLLLKTILRQEWNFQGFSPFLKHGIQESLGARQFAQTLFGENNPTDRLTITFPRSVGQLPDFYNSDPSRVYKYVDDDGQPLFPFGFGLSYTTFRYDHLVAKPPASRSKGDITVTVDVTNIGSREGDEVAQLYVHQK